MNQINEKNILLRAHGYDENDLNNYHVLFSTTEVMKYVSFPRSLSKKESEERPNKTHANNDEKLFAVINKTNGSYMGRCGISIKVDARIGEIGYMVLPAYWKMGYGTQIADLIIDYGLNSLKLNKIIATCDIRNRASERIL